MLLPKYFAFAVHTPPRKLCMPLLDVVSADDDDGKHLKLSECTACLHCACVRTAHCPCALFLQEPDAPKYEAAKERYRLNAVFLDFFVVVPCKCFQHVGSRLISVETPPSHSASVCQLASVPVRHSQSIPDEYPMPFSSMFCVEVPGR